MLELNAESSPLGGDALTNLIGELPETNVTDETDLAANEHELTILAEAPTETNITDIINPIITNEDFLTAIFGTMIGEQRPVTCMFPGDPRAVAKGSWFGMPWLLGKKLWSPTVNSYFSLACFNPDGEGKYRRQKKNFAALPAVMLDDIGTKAEGLERLTIPPSWLLETSPGNMQAGYIFSAPVTDGAAAERLMKGIIAAGLCDPGADGPLARYARLPIGVNGKHTPPFQCRLVEWQPDRRYTIEQMVEGLQLDYSADTTKRPSKKGSGSRVASDSDDVYVARADENPVIAALKGRGLYKSPLGSGKHDLICPWQDEHAEGVGGGTAYFEPDESWPRGGFKCLHGHCADRHVKALLEHLGISKAEAKHRPLIRVAAGELSQIVDHCERELAVVGKYYQRGGLLVSVVTDPGTKETSVKSLSMPSLVRALSGMAGFERYDKRNEEWVPCDPPERHSKVLFDGEKYPHMPVLNGIARQPYLRPDGSLMIEPGYDRATGMFGVFAKQDFRVLYHPTKLDAENALKIIDDLLVEFSFRSDYDRSAALSAILTAAIRSSLALALMFHICAPQIASGKSYLCSLIAAFATPMSTPATAFPIDDEECRKLLLSALLTAPSVMCFDNLTSDLIPHKSLCSALTEEFITGRILGVSKTATVGTRALFLSSGNNVNPVRDMTRRTVTITLDPACETPAARTFKIQPVETVKANRGRFVSLALTIVRAWIVAGRPCSEVKSLATYTDWSGLCRQSLLWLGRPDPATSVFQGMAEDPDREILGQLLHAWAERFADRPTMVRDAVTNASPELREAFLDIAGERADINRKRLGRWIGRHAGRIVDGLRFEKDSCTRSAEAWRVKSVMSVLTVSVPVDSKNGSVPPRTVSVDI